MIEMEKDGLQNADAKIASLYMTYRWLVRSIYYKLLLYTKLFTHLSPSKEFINNLLTGELSRYFSELKIGNELFQKTSSQTLSVK